MSHKSQIPITKSQRGFVVLFTTFFILIIMLTIAMSMGSLTFFRTSMATAQVKSTQSYYAAESGAEDALLRLKNNPSLSPISYNLTVNGATTAVNIPAMVGGSRAVTSQGNLLNRNRTIQVVYAVDGDGVGFNYGAQVGEGGLQMGNNSVIHGSVFSGGNIAGSGTIDNDVIVSGNGHSIDDVYVGGNAQVYSCLSPASVNNLTYVIGGSHTCTVRGTTSSQASEIPPQALPLSQSQIDDWKTQAAEGGTTSGNVSLLNGASSSIGPRKITGNLTLSNNATLTVTGTIHVVGNLSISNNSTIRLSSSYGGVGGIIIVDGTITIGNGSTLTGSGTTGSYLLMLSTSTSSVAIDVNNNAAGSVIFYASAGTIDLSNGVGAKEVTGYRVVLNNNAVITYESGLSSAFFSGGPSGGWKVTSWTEE